MWQHLKICKVLDYMSGETSRRRDNSCCCVTDYPKSNSLKTCIVSHDFLDRNAVMTQVGSSVSGSLGR